MELQDPFLLIYTQEGSMVKKLPLLGLNCVDVETRACNCCAKYKIWIAAKKREAPDANLFISMWACGDLARIFTFDLTSGQLVDKVDIQERFIQEVNMNDHGDTIYLLSDVAVHIMRA